MSAGLITGDDELDECRAELIANDRSEPPEPPCGAAAATASSMQNQHVADSVSGAARRMYLDVPEDVMAKVTPFEQYTVLDTLTQVLYGVRPPTLLPTKLTASVRTLYRSLRAPTSSSRCKSQRPSGSGCVSSSLSLGTSRSLCEQPHSRTVDRGPSVRTAFCCEGSWRWRLHYTSAWLRLAGRCAKDRKQREL